MAKTFHEQLIAARNAQHSKNHPFIDLWAQGKLTKPQMAVYVVQHYHFVSDYLNWMLYVAALTPHCDVKTFLLENFIEEEDPDNRHIDMLFDFAAACGMPKELFLATPVLPSTQALQDWGWRQVYEKPWQVAIAGMFIGLEPQPPDIYQRLVPAFSHYYGWREGSQEVRFFAEHIEADTMHGARGFAIVEQYCDTAALQQQAVAQVKVAAIMRWRHMNGIYWNALQGRFDDTPPRETV
jgi:pyrroloquinoline quinone (PQQ) biosynthesis protein C